MIYYFSQIEEFEHEDLKRAYMLLPDSRKKKVHKYKRYIDKKLSILAYCLLEYGLNKEKEICEIPEFEYGKYNKPYFGDLPDVFFNISHCKNGILCGISKYEIGVDIECIDKKNLSCRDLVMSNKELELIEKSKFPEKTFTRFWVLKESYLKNKGTGIAEDLNKLDFSTEVHNKFCYKERLFKVSEFSNSFISICSSEELKFNFVDIYSIKHRRG